MLVAVALPDVARAETLHGTVESMINLFPDPQQRQLQVVAPFLQWVTLHAERLNDQDMGVHLSGYGGFDLGNAFFDGHGAGDLNVAQFRYRDAGRGTELVLGRQYLMLGLARAEHFDGLHVVQTLPGGLRLELFGGVHAGPRMTYQAGDWLAGGRVGYRFTDVVSAGVSFLQAREQERLARELVGADVVVHPKKWLEAGVGALYDTIGSHLAQLDLFATVYPRDGLRVAADWRRVVPVALLDKTSIFSVFSDAVRNEAGGDVSWKLDRRVTLRADAHAMFFDDGQTGYRAGASAVFTLGARDENTLTLRAGRFRDATDGYTDLRAATRHYFTASFFGALDVQAYRYDVGVRGETLSFGVTAALGYDVARKLRVILAAEGGITPEFEARGQLMARLEWNYWTSF